MRFDKPLLAAAIAASFFPAAHADVSEFEFTGYLKNETAIFLKDGQTIGQAKSTLDTEENSAGDVFKSETMLRGFANGDLTDNTSLHAEINLIYDSEGVNKSLRGHKSYTQHDYLRELYIDTVAGDWNLRLGKQQVVWGTADGIKLLDIINPTDFRELNQNVQEDSRVPIWMANVERNVGDSGNIQFIASEARPNYIPGLNGDGDHGQPFMLTGVDTITGQVNGFQNIAPQLGNTAAKFVGLAQQGFGAPSLTAAGGGFLNVGMFADGLSPFCQTSTDGQTPNPTGTIPGPQSPQNPFAGLTCGQMLDAIAQNPFPTPSGDAIPGNESITNLVGPEYDSANPDSAFEYMDKATFATFDTFAGISTQYKKSHPNPNEGNLGMRYKGATDGGTNFSLNYLYNYNPNPSVNLSWKDKAGNPLAVNHINTVGVDANQDGDQDDQVETPGGPIPESELPSQLTSIALANADGTAFNPLEQEEGPATLVFEETLDRTHNLGASFDTNVDTESLGTVVLRGEFLYQQDVMVPVIDRNELAIGNLVGSLKTEETDFFKSVLGVDITVMTNLLVSTQLINFFNLDYMDENLDSNGVACAGVANCGRYTGDPSTLSLLNNMKKGDEIETFISFFLSKPFGAEQQHRWNNIIIAENDGGYWDRFDVEYSFTDFIIGTAETNFYWGDKDTTFGQFDKSSNLQLGVKYLFQ